MEDEQLTCPECGQDGFKSTAGLSVHRRYKHNVDGASAKTSMNDRILQRLAELEEKIDSGGSEGLTRQDISEIVANETNSVFSRLPELLSKEVTNMPSDQELDDMCRRFPDLCAKVSNIENLVGSHPKPTRGLLDLWDNCPECRSMLRAMADRGEFDLYKTSELDKQMRKKYDKVGVVAESEEEEEEPDLPWVTRSK